jgi:molybdopterin-guanine dinucleotide biosynthesis protein A
LKKRIIAKILEVTNLYGTKTTTLVILAGGRGTRLGCNKALANFNGQSLIETVISRLAQLHSPLLIVTSREQFPAVAELNLNQKIVVDCWPGKGVMGAIYTSLLHSASSNVFVAGCDMPFLSTAFIDYLIDISSGWDAVVPKSNGLNEPLHAVYSRNCLNTLERLLGEDSLATRELFNRVNTKYIYDGEIEKYCRGSLSFFNINTPADFMNAQLIAEQSFYADFALAECGCRT